MKNIQPPTPTPPPPPPSTELDDTSSFKDLKLDFEQVDEDAVLDMKTSSSQTLPMSHISKMEIRIKNEMNEIRQKNISSKSHSPIKKCVSPSKSFEK